MIYIWSDVRVLHAFWLKGGGGGGILKSRTGIPIFYKCGVIALFEAFYMFKCLEIITMLK